MTITIPKWIIYTWLVLSLISSGLDIANYIIKKNKCSKKVAYFYNTPKGDVKLGTYWGVAAKNEDTTFFCEFIPKSK